VSNVENLPPHVLRGVSKEVIALSQEPPEGIKIFINHDDITDVQASIIGPGNKINKPHKKSLFVLDVFRSNLYSDLESTPYAGGAFKLKLVLGKDFPAGPPKGYFLTKIFHPNVSTSGEICVNALKKDWNPKLGLKHIFLVISLQIVIRFT
jgi:ubiquitin-conjugating enzyme E2 S